MSRRDHLIWRQAARFAGSQIECVQCPNGILSPLYGPTNVSGLLPIREWPQRRRDSVEIEFRRKRLEFSGIRPKVEDLELSFRVDLENQETAIWQHFRIQRVIENQPFFPTEDWDAENAGSGQFAGKV